MPKLIEASTLKARLRRNEELALVDIREDIEFYQNHLLFAVNMPLSRLEQMVEDLIPRKSVPVILCDGGDNLAARAATRFEWLGYRDVSVLAGGIGSWEAAGGVLFAGANVPSKAFGEFVEHEYQTPRLTAQELKARIDKGEDMVILDSRPWEEFQIMSIPGGQDCPGAELVYRSAEAIPTATTTVIVNCAGRTRSIIGTQSLVNAGIPNPVYALKDGTMGWELAGYEVARKSEKRVPNPSRTTIENAHKAASAVAKRAGVRLIDMHDIDQFRREREAHTLYILDVRTPEEYDAGHLEDAIHAFGGQLVQATDRYIAVRGARIVLTDDNEVRALMTGSWLRQMGWDEVYVLAGGVTGSKLATGRKKPDTAGLDSISPSLLSPADAHALVSSGKGAIIDLADPRRYLAEHIEGAWYAVRSKLPAGLEQFDQGLQIVITSSDGRIAALAAAELTEATGRTVAALKGGTAAWKKAKLPVEAGEQKLLHPRREMWSPYDEKHRTRQSMLDYLSWEVDLYDRIKRDGDANFRKLSSG